MSNLWLLKTKRLQVFCVYTLKRETARSESEASEQHGFLKGLFQPWDHNLPAASEARQVWTCLGLKFIIYWGNSSCWVRVRCEKRPNVLTPALTASGKPWLGAVTMHNLTCSLHFLCGVWNDSSHHRTLSTDWAEDVSQGKGERRRSTRQEMPKCCMACASEWQHSPSRGGGRNTKTWAAINSMKGGVGGWGWWPRQVKPRKKGMLGCSGSGGARMVHTASSGFQLSKIFTHVGTGPLKNEATLELVVQQTEHCIAQLLPWPVSGSLSGVSTPEYCSFPPMRKSVTVLFCLTGH